MKRRLFKRLFVFLLGGAIANVAVAWGCSLWSPIFPVALTSTTNGFGVDFAWSRPSGPQWSWKAGLPLRSLECVTGRDGPEVLEPSIRLPTWIPVERKIMPCGPISPGFAINTIVYAAVLWLVFAFPLELRRYRRRKRGLCPACAYPIGESRVCTECARRLTKSWNSESNSRVQYLTNTTRSPKHVVDGTRCDPTTYLRSYLL
jgi:hypothetical protein